MRISDWSSDVCSSDLRLQRAPPHLAAHAHRHLMVFAGAHHAVQETQYGDAQPVVALRQPWVGAVGGDQELRQVGGADGQEIQPDRKSVVEGKRVYVRVDLGGGGCINKKKQTSI